MDRHLSSSQPCRKMYLFARISVILSIFFITARCETKNECKKVLSDELIEEISSYKTVRDEILNYVLEGDFKGKTYHELANFVDTFSGRPSGSQVLEDSIDYMIQLSREEKLNDITTEELEVPHWIRGAEKILMLQPRIKPIAVLGLAPSIPTPPEGITAEVVVVSSFDELNSLPDAYVAGKIILYDEPFTTYNETTMYRITGAVRAAEKGAVASIIRSVATFSINSPHTGLLKYDDNVRKIPAAAISLEDADLLRRIYDRGNKIVLHINMSSLYETKPSRNTLIDWKGTTKPDKLVIVSGHIDSWDVGQGAMDDGGGLFVSWAVPVILKRLNLRPKRTIRSIFWTAEEYELVGAYAYEKKHSKDNKNINFIMESDEGTFTPLGLNVAGTKEARCVIGEVLKLFEDINVSTLVEHESGAPDIGVFVKKGVPGAGLHTDSDRHYWFHHTEGDTMNVEDPDELDLCAAFYTAVAYILADLSIDIPR